MIAPAAPLPEVALDEAGRVVLLSPCCGADPVRTATGRPACSECMHALPEAYGHTSATVAEALAPWAPCPGDVAEAEEWLGIVEDAIVAADARARAEAPRAALARVLRALAASEELLGALELLPSAEELRAGVAAPEPRLLGLPAEELAAEAVRALLDRLDEVRAAVA